MSGKGTSAAIIRHGRLLVQTFNKPLSPRMSRFLPGRNDDHELGDDLERSVFRRDWGSCSTQTFIIAFLRIWSPETALIEPFLQILVVSLVPRPIRMNNPAIPNETGDLLIIQPIIAWVEQFLSGEVV